jgi:DNA helicase-2/ATP-dependent DNA helicase PcrA
MDRLHDDAEVRQADVEQLARIAAPIRAPSAFLTELTLDPPEATSDQAGPPLLDEDYLILSTIHSAKGQEWTAVSVLNVVDGCIPSDMATGSRSRNRGRATPALRCHDPRQGTPRPHRAAALLRFPPARLRRSPSLCQPHTLHPNALLPCFEQVAWPAPAAASPANPNAKQQALDLAARMRAMWK